MSDHYEYLETPLPFPRVFTDVRMYGRSLARSYADVITKFSRLDGLPIFLTHCASLARSRAEAQLKLYLYILPGEF